MTHRPSLRLFRGSLLPDTNRASRRSCQTSGVGTSYPCGRRTGPFRYPPLVVVEFRVAFLDESEYLGTRPAELLIVDRAHPPLFAVCSVCLEEMLCCDPCPWAVRLFSSVWPRGPTYDVGIDTPLHPLRNGIAAHPLLFDRLCRSKFCRNELISTPRQLLITRLLMPFFKWVHCRPFPVSLRCAPARLPAPC
jgi:hypothetical protein